MDTWQDYKNYVKSIDGQIAFKIVFNSRVKFCKSATAVKNLYITLRCEKYYCICSNISVK